jgi:hypothetical protein
LSCDERFPVALYDEMNGLFLALGMNEEQARIAASGRGFRSEAEARAADVDFEADDLADQMIAAAATRTDPLVRGRQEVAAAIPQVTANVYRILAGQPRALYPWEADPATATVAGEAVVESAQATLNMTESEARDFLERLRTRETRRGGAAHAEKFLATFAAGLQRNVREVAPQ